MTPSYQIRVYHNGQLKFSKEFARRLEIGRQKDASEPPPSRTDRYAAGLVGADGTRLLIAPIDETDISRVHVQLDPLPGGKVRVKNISTSQPVAFADRAELKTGSPPVELPVPFTLYLGSRTIEVCHRDDQEADLQSLADVTRLPGRPVDLPSMQYTMNLAGGHLDFEGMLTWLQSAMEVLQSAANSTAFFQKAAQAAVNLVGLTSSQVLLLDRNAWKPVAWHHATVPTGTAPTHAPSQRVLARLRDERKTFWRTGRLEDGDDSLLSVRAVVASPILDRQGQVIGALYGDRHEGHAATSALPLTRLEAVLLELLATGVATGLARVEQERVTLEARVQFEQFSTQELAYQLAANPDMLKGSDAEVTVLFCDLRRFSHFSEKLGPAKTVEWIADVMEVLSDCVLAHQGVLVDYIGDELMAMWGAPAKQPDHAARAARAALAMCAQVPQLNKRWGPVLGEPMNLGIGLNTGLARVGNTGTKRKFKYGPLGNTVNLASRVQGATKMLKVRLLLTEATKKGLGNVAARRVGKVRVQNIDAPVELYELRGEEEPGWAALRSGYEAALADFERGEFGRTAHKLGNLLSEHPGDGPTLVLLARAVGYLVQEPKDFEAVWELPGK